MSPCIEMLEGRLSTLLLNLVDLCLLQQMEYSRNDARPEKSHTESTFFSGILLDS